ncbi:MAG: phosphopentomutase [Firmicutes bacterium]|nr:phosphopentomutase [Bacillota bacterium]
MARAIIIVLDAVGIGELPDAADYGDEGSNTLMHVKAAVPETTLKNMCRMGLGLIEDCDNIYDKVDEPLGFYGKAAEVSKGKDTTTGHWEIAGLELSTPFPTYPHGFPKEVIEEFEKRIGRKTLGNYPASGTEIIKQLGPEHIKTGFPIVYTSADSVFQIAAHKGVIPLETLYEYCRIARKLLQGEHGVARVIARPFEGEEGSFVRTSERHDFSLPPTGKTLLDYVKQAGMEVKAVGKIKDIFADTGITEHAPTSGNAQGIEETLKFIKQDFDGLIFTNLVDTDMLYGHRNDPVGFSGALEYFDSKLPEILDNLHKDDLLFITADHGCDPTTSSTDHSREHIFILGVGGNIKGNIGTRQTYSDIGKTAADFLKIPNELKGRSFL